MLSAYTNVLAHHGLGRFRHVKFLHSEITSEVVFDHKYHSFSLAYILASRPHESDRTC